MKPATLVLACSFVAALAAAQPAPAPPSAPAPAPTPAPEVAKRPLTLDLDRAVNLEPDRGHAEFDMTSRREVWADPMVRLGMALGREEAAATSGRGISFPPALSPGYLLATTPGADPRLILKGPWAEDWHDLSTQEKIGRIAEDAVYAGLIIGILHSLR